KKKKKKSYYDNAAVVVIGLESLTKCAVVEGAFAPLESAGVPEVAVQCMLEHAGQTDVQWEGLKLLATLAQHKDALVWDALCEPIIIETVLKAVQINEQKPMWVGILADFVNGLLQDQDNRLQIVQGLQTEKIPDFLRRAFDTHYKMDVEVGPKIMQVLKQMDTCLLMPTVDVDAEQWKVGESSKLAMQGPSVSTQLVNMAPDQLLQVMGQWSIKDLLSVIKSSKNPKLIRHCTVEINRRLNDGGLFFFKKKKNGGQQKRFFFLLLLY
ncbi:hypothetical protein RFI_10656, partial [Reticulomyxa filosa]